MKFLNKKLGNMKRIKGQEHLQLNINLKIEIKFE